MPTAITMNDSDIFYPNQAPQPTLNPRQIEILQAETILERCGRGEKTALEALLKRFERPIYHLAYRLAGNYDDAHDVAATATLRICQTIGTCKSAVTLPAWINRIVTNVFYDMYRRSSRCPAVSLEAITERTNEEYFPYVDIYQNTPQSNVEEKERKSVLNSAISLLPSFQCKIVKMFYQDELTYNEIADIMDIPVGTVKSRLSRARIALLKSLNSQQAVLMK